MSVYFAQAGPYIKIGYSEKPLSRISTVTTSGTRPADLPRATDARPLGWIPGDTRREIEMHVRFADRRVDGEWFTITVEEAREAIWADPAGIDVERMSALAVIVSHEHQGITRQQLAAAGIPVDAVTGDEAVASLSRVLGAALGDVA